jgi:hypothetical protein
MECHRHDNRVQGSAFDEISLRGSLFLRGAEMCPLVLLHDARHLWHTLLLRIHNRAETNIKMQSALSVRKEEMALGSESLKERSHIQSDLDSAEI